MLPSLSKDKVKVHFGLCLLFSLFCISPFFRVGYSGLCWHWYLEPNTTFHRLCYHRPVSHFPPLFMDVLQYLESFLWFERFSSLFRAGTGEPVLLQERTTRPSLTSGGSVCRVCTWTRPPSVTPHVTGVGKQCRLVSVFPLSKSGFRSSLPIPSQH